MGYDLHNKNGRGFNLIVIFNKSENNSKSEYINYTDVREIFKHINKITAK